MKWPGIFPVESPKAILRVSLVWLWVIVSLLESAVKRKSGYKDSGFIIPGHGGILDRMDGALISFPVMYLLIYFDILKLNL